MYMAASPMDVLVALMPRLGVDAAACVGLSLKQTRWDAAVRLQATVRRLLALWRFKGRVVMELVRLLERHRDATTAVEKALPGLYPLPAVRQMVLLRVIVVGGV